ncbi:MAG: putative dsRNA-binding protein [Pseudomonadota bacterium]
MAEIARDLKLSEYLRLGQGEQKSGGYLRESILADVIEALIGAVLLDGGFHEARRVVRSLLDELEHELPEADSLKDPKTRLQEWLQGRGHDLPEYRVLEEHGADHIKRFEVECRVGELAEPVQAEAGSRRKAEQAAARLMHARLTQGAPS